MTIYEEYAIELLLGDHLKGRAIGGNYITAYMYECKINNAEKLDKWLLKNDYLRKPTITESLTRYKVSELKEFLSQKGIKTVGRKDELINRLLSVLSEHEIASQIKSDNRYFLSEKGLSQYYENIDLEEFHKNAKYNISLEDYFKYRKVNGVIRDYYETARFILEERMMHNSTNQLKSNRIPVSDYSIFSEICEKMEDYEDALIYLLKKLYLITNLANSFYLNKEHIFINDINDLCNDLKNERDTIFNIKIVKRILLFAGYYSHKMVDDIYQNMKLQYIVFDKENFKSAIDDMIESAYFNASPYMEIILKNYKQIAIDISLGKSAVNPL